MEESLCIEMPKFSTKLVEELVSIPTTLQRVASYVIKNYAHTPLSTLGPLKKLIHTSAEASTSFTSEELFDFKQIYV